MCVCVLCNRVARPWIDCLLIILMIPVLVSSQSSSFSLVQLDDFDAYFKEMSKDSAYKFSLQFEVSALAPPAVLKMKLQSYSEKPETLH